MLKQSIVYLLLSVLVVLFAKYAGFAIVYIDLFYTFVNLKLTSVFHNTIVDDRLRNILALILIPIIIAGTPALIYRLIKKQNMPYFFEAVWIIWLVLILSDILIR